MLSASGGATVAVIPTFSPTYTETADLSRTTPVTFFTTLTSTEAVTVPSTALVAVTVAVPFVFAVSLPFATVTTFSSVVVQMSCLSVVSEGRIVTSRRNVALAYFNRARIDNN